VSPRPDLVQIVLSLGAGGTERLVIDMSRLLAERANVHVLCTDESGEWAEQLTNCNIPVTTLGRQPGFDRALVTQIRQFLRQLEKPVVHCHHYTPFVYGALGSLFSKHRLVYTEHGRYDDGKPSVKRRLANQFLGRLPGHFFAVSHDLRNHLLHEGFSPSRMFVNHNGIDISSLPTPDERERVRAELGLSADDFVVGTVARLHPVKDLRTLLTANSQPSARTKLVIVGDGEQRAELEQLSAQLGLTENVHFLGQRADARTLLPALDVFVNCSIIEGISVTILEAMSAGVPVIATAVGGTPEIIHSDAIGTLVPSRDPNALRVALDGLQENPARRKNLSLAARARVQEEFSTTAMVSRYLDAYDWPV
jgi:glycosyltransferase involved in cell wall biosynthesis